MHSDATLAGHRHAKWAPTPAELSQTLPKGGYGSVVGRRPSPIMERESHPGLAQSADEQGRRRVQPAGGMSSMERGGRFAQCHHKRN